MAIKAMAPESQAFSELQRELYEASSSRYDNHPQTSFFSCSVLVCVHVCVKRRVSRLHKLALYLSGLPLQSPWHLDNKGHIWKSKSAQTPMLIYSYIYKREGEFVKMAGLSPTAENHMLNVSELTVSKLHTRVQLIYMTSIIFRTVIIAKDLLQYNWGLTNIRPILMPTLLVWGH